MDNDAFKDLVRQRAQEKTSKEVAREAVEDEFRRRKKRKKNSSGYSSSDSEDGKDDYKRPVEERPTMKRNIFHGKSAEKPKYRDRARERREGKNKDYTDSKNMLEGFASATSEHSSENQQAALSKYLGGDEDHTHLVKGLDVVLVRKEKEKRRLAQSKDSLLPSVKTHVMTISEARDKLQRQIESRSIIAQVGHDMMDYIRKVDMLTNYPKSEERKVGGSALWISAQRSTFSLAMDGHPSDSRRAWEVPREIVRSMQHTDQEEVTSSLTPLSFRLIGLMKSVLQSRQEKQNLKEAGESNHEEVEGTKHLRPSGTENSRGIHSTEGPSNDDESYDDDIFGDVGDYIPPSVQVPGRPEENMTTQTPG